MISAHCGHRFDDFENTEVYRDQVAVLMDEGMIVSVSNAQYRFKTTPKGDFWLNTILETKFPVEEKIWRIPQ